MGDICGGAHSSLRRPDRSCNPCVLIRSHASPDLPVSTHPSISRNRQCKLLGPANHLHVSYDRPVLIPLHHHQTHVVQTGRTDSQLHSKGNRNAHLAIVLAVRITPLTLSRPAPIPGFPIVSPVFYIRQPF